jgi:hypothetical protein
MMDLKPTSAREIRAAKRTTVLVKMPVAGWLAELRSISFHTLILSGKVPDHLTSMVVKLWNGESPLGAPRSEQEEYDAIKMLFELQQLVAREMFVLPRIVDHPDEESDEEIHINDLEQEDLSFVYSFLYRPARELESFRYQPDTNVESVVTESSNADKTLETAGLKKVG